MDISNHLRLVTGLDRGLSPRSVGRFCTRRNIHCRSGFSTPLLDQVVYDLVTRVGHAYGRRTMHGLLNSQGVRVSQRRLAASMYRVAPLQYASRRHNTNRLLNPLTYRAHHFGEKLHLDQNEKCAMFGVTHVLAIDGFSRKIVGFVTIKQVLIDMENNEEVDMNDEITKFCVSWVTISVMACAVHTFITAWNSHRIPGPDGGIPNVLAAQSNSTVQLHPTSVPSAAQLVQINERAQGHRSNIRPDATVGHDPLRNQTQLQEVRTRDFFHVFPDLNMVFQDVLHGNGLLFLNSIRTFIRLTNQLATLL